MIDYANPTVEELQVEITRLNEVINLKPVDFKNFEEYSHATGCAHHCLEMMKHWRMADRPGGYDALMERLSRYAVQ